MAVVKFHHDVLEWELGHWRRTPFSPWDINHCQSYWDYCNREHVRIEQICHALAAWYAQLRLQPIRLRIQEIGIYMVMVISNQLTNYIEYTKSK